MHASKHSSDEISKEFLFFNTFRAYARQRTGELLDADDSCQAQLIHISRYDARLRLQNAACRFSPGRLLQLRVAGNQGTQQVQTRASVHWVQDNELGLLFTAPLDVGARELQALLD